MSDGTEVHSQPESQFDHEKLAALYLRMQGEQSFVLALVAGFVTAIAGALIWAAVTAATGYQIGWMAVGVGFLVGFGVRALGKGVTKPFGVIGGVMSLFGCLLGNLLSICMVIANIQDIPFTQVLTNLDPGFVVDLMVQSFHPMDLLFYAIAVYEGYRFSFRKLSEEELSSVTSEPSATA